MGKRTREGLKEVPVFFTEEEHRELKVQVARLGTSMAAWLRWLALSSLKLPGGSLYGAPEATTRLAPVPVPAPKPPPAPPPAMRPPRVEAPMPSRSEKEELLESFEAADKELLECEEPGEGALLLKKARGFQMDLAKLNVRVQLTRDKM